MAIDPRDILITRDDVYSWLVEYYAQDPEAQGDLRAFLLDKLDTRDAADVVVDLTNSGRDEELLIDLILEDLPTYGPFS